MAQISTEGISNVFTGIKGMILGQESNGYSRKFLMLPVAALVCWKLPAVTHSKAWDDILKLAMLWMICQGFVDGCKAIGEAFKKPSA